MKRVLYAALFDWVSLWLFTTSAFASASAASYSAEVGTISTSVSDYFRDIAATLPWGSKYVFFRHGDYDYILAYSDDLELSGDTFSASSVEIVKYNGYYRETDYGITRYQESNFRVTAGRANVYSNLGIYPRLFEGVSTYAFQALLVVVVLGFVLSYVLRFFR